MEYLFSKVIRRIKSNFKKNIMIALQISIGVILFVLIINVSYHIQKIYNSYMNNGNNYIYNIMSIPLTKTNSSVLNEQQYFAITEISDVTLSLEILTDIISLEGMSHIIDNEEILDKYVIKYSNTCMQVATEPEFLNMLEFADKNNTVNYDDIFFYYEDDMIYFRDNTNVQSTLFDDGKDDIHMIVFPLEYFFKYGDKSNNCTLNISVKVLSKTSSQCSNKLYEIENTLETFNSNYDYVIESDFFDFLQKSSSDKEQAMLLGLISIILIIIVYLGIVCLLMMMFEKRTFELSVCLSFGAKVKSIITEFVLELFIITIVPTFLTLMLIHICLSNGFILINVYIPQLCFAIDIIAIAFILLADMVCIIPIFQKINNLKPQEILREY